MRLTINNMKARNYTYRLKPSSKYAGGNEDAQFVLKLAAALTIYVLVSLMYAQFIIEHTPIFHH